METKNKMGKLIIAVILCIVMPVAVFAAEAETHYMVAYDGGSLANVKSGTDLKLYIDTNTVRLVKSKDEVANIPVTAITEISYGQDVHRRVGAAIGLAVVSLGIGGLMALTKSKKHYIGITWVDGEKKGGFAMQCDKNEYRGILTALEGVSGKKAVNSDAMTVKN
jgi:hypothetical protein